MAYAEMNDGVNYITRSSADAQRTATKRWEFILVGIVFYTYVLVMLVLHKKRNRGSP